MKRLDEDRALAKAESQRLKELFAAKKSVEKEQGYNYTQQDIADVGGWTQPNVSSYLNGIAELKEDSALVFSRALGVPVASFSPRLAEKIALRELINQNPNLIHHQISYAPKLTSAVLDQIKNKLHDTSLIMPLMQETVPTTQKLPLNAFAFELTNKSLEPRIMQGTTFIFDPNLKPVPTDMVLVGNKNKDGDYHIREYNVLEVTEDGVDKCEFKALNPAFPTLRENYEVIGVWIGYYRSIARE